MDVLVESVVNPLPNHQRHGSGLYDRNAIEEEKEEEKEEEEVVVVVVVVVVIVVVGGG
jgi:hypothetical protein